MTCKDCIHNDVCRGVYLAIQDNTKLTLKEFQILCEKEDFDNQDIALYDCLFFQDRSRFVELPCKIGTELFRIKQINGKRFITNTALNSNTFWNIVMQGEFGKTVFLTREAAEQALKECGKDE